MRAPDFWRGPSIHPAAWPLLPFAALYGAMAAARLKRPGPRAALPTLVVGGLTVGGDGKTPAALALARLLIAEGERPFFLTRGYGRDRRLRESFLVDPARHGPLETGDEALLLAQIAPTIVGADRVASARLAKESGASVLVLDDGLHSRQLQPDLALLVVDADYGAGNGLCLPAGPLRAPVAAQMAILDAVLTIGDGAAAEGVAALGESMGKPSLRARLRPTAEGAERMCGRRVFAFAGIARPEKFQRSLHEAGAILAGTRWFGDHHRFSGDELSSLEVAAQRADAALVTTQKDAARMGSPGSVETLPVELVFERPINIERLLARALEKARALRV